MEEGYMNRREAIRAECKIFVIVCEGETEKIYFNGYRKRRCNLIIKTPNTTVTDPINLVRFAKTQIKRFDLDLKNDDEVWCVFDADGNTDANILKAIREAGSDIKIILSNPSFEIWYLLHFLYTTNRIDNKTLVNSLNKYIPNYQKTENYFAVLSSKRDNAIRNAKKLNDFHTKNGVDLNSTLSNPSTQAFKIVENILKIIGCSVGDRIK